jgi:hypothetical protein
MSDAVAAATMIVPEIRTLCDYDDVHSARERVDAALRAATIYPRREDTEPVYALPTSDEAKAFIRELGILMDTEDFAGGDVIPFCMGTTWFNKETIAIFGQLVEGDPVWFLRQHMHRYISDVLFDSELLLLISDEHRFQFIRDALMASTPANEGWVKGVLGAGLSNDQVAKLILERLRNTHVDLKYNMADFVRSSFARYGAQFELDSCRRTPYLSSGQITYWSILSDEQLFEALDICDEKAPGILFYEKNLMLGLQARFIGLSRDDEATKAGQRIIDGLLVKHANKLTSLARVDYDMFGMLPSAKQVELVKKFDGGNTVYLVHAAMAALDWGLFDKYVGALALKDKGNYAHVLINTQSVLQPTGVSLPIDHAEHCDERIQLAGHITKILESNARWAGFILGVVRKQHGDNYVTDTANSWVYIHDWMAADRTSNRYFPQEGDYVMFRKPRIKTVKHGGIQAIFIKVR